MHSFIFIVMFFSPIYVFAESIVTDSNPVDNEIVTQKKNEGDDISASCVNGTRSCQSCTTDVSHTVGGHHFFCSGGQWKSVTPIKCDTASPCKN